MIESAIQLTFSLIAGAFRIAIPASTRSTIAAGVLSCVLSIHFDMTIADDKESHPRVCQIPLLGLSLHLSTIRTSAR